MQQVEHESFGDEMFAIWKAGDTSEERQREVFAKWEVPYVRDFFTRQDLRKRTAFHLRPGHTPDMLLPYWGTGKEALNAGELLASANRVGTPDEKPGDQERSIDFLIAQRQERTWGAAAADVFMDAPRYMIEWATTGAGLKATGLIAKEAAKEAAEKAAKWAITKRVGKEIMLRAALTPRVMTETYHAAYSQILEGVGPDEAGDLSVMFNSSAEDFLSALGQGYRSSLYETASEMSGVGLAKGTKAAKQAFGKALPGAVNMYQAALVRAGMQKTGKSALEVANEFLKKGGWNGAIEEYGEEVFGGLLRAVDPVGKLTGAEELGDTAEDIVPGYADGGIMGAIKEGTAMIAGFGAFGGAVRGGAQALRLSPGATAAPAQPEADAAQSQAGPTPTATEGAAPQAPSRGTQAEQDPARIQAQVESFAPGGKQVEPRTQVQRRAADWARARTGSEILFVEPGEQGAAGFGVSIQEGRILIDSTIEDEAIVQHTAGHEVFHDVVRAFEAAEGVLGSPSELLEQIRTVAPTEHRRALRAFSRRQVESWRDRGLALGSELRAQERAEVKGRLAEEGAADLMGELMPVIGYLATDEGKGLARRLMGERTLWEGLVDGMVRLVRGTKGVRARRKARVESALSEIGSATGGEVSLAEAKVARVFNDAMDLVFRAREEGLVRESEAGAPRVSPAPAKGTEGFRRMVGVMHPLAKLDEGTPRRFYHATPDGGFTEFRPGETGIDERGVTYFSSSPKATEGYLEWGEEPEDPARVARLQAIVDQHRPALDRLSDAMDAWGREEVEWEEYERLEEQIKREYPDLELARRAQDSIRRTPMRDVLEGGSMYEVFLAVENPYVEDFKGSAWDPERQRKAIDFARIHGHDSVVFKNVMDDPMGGVVADSWAVFDPEKIKSTTGHRGDYDTQQRDIRLSPAAFHGGPHEFELSAPALARLRDVYATADEDQANRLIRDAHALADVYERTAFSEHGFGGLEVPGQRMVLLAMRRVAHQPEVLDAIVESVPVDVMDMLRGLQGTPEVQLHDDAVLEPLAAIDGYQAVPLVVDVANRAAGVIAGLAAEVPGVALEDMRALQDASSAMVAGRLDHAASLLQPGAFDDADVEITGRFSPAGDINSRQFKRWFGASKVVDKDGKPLVAYHGTARDYTIASPPYWASEDPELADKYAYARRNIDRAGAERIMPVYLAIERPFDADQLPKSVTVSRFLAEMAQQAPNAISKEDFMRIRAAVQAGAREEESGPNYSRHEFWILPADVFGRDGAASLQELWDLSGFDGIAMMEQGSRTWAALSPEQVKSATGNIGSYRRDIKDPRLSPQGDLPRKGTPAEQKRAQEVRRKFALGAGPTRRVAPMGESEAERQYSRAIVSEMEDRGEPGYLSVPDTLKAGRALYESDPKEVERKLMDAALYRNPIGPEEQAAARMLVSEAARKALGAKTEEESKRHHARAVRLGNALRIVRTSTAQALSNIRDERPAWAKSAQDKMADLLYTPPPRFGNRIKKLELAIRKEQKRKEGEAKQKELERLNKRLNRMLEKDAELMRRAVRQLQEQGIDPTALTREDMQDPAIVRRVTETINVQRFGIADWYTAFRLNAMLTGPGTHIRNIGGNVVNTTLEVGARRASEALVASIARKLTGRQLERSASWSEFKAMGPALMQSFPVAGQTALSAWKTGMPGLESWLLKQGFEAPELASKLEHRELTTIPSKKFAYLDYLGFRALEAGDALIKSTAFMTEHAALAWRAAKDEAEPGEDVQTRFGLILQDPNHPVMEEAYSKSLLTAFQGPQDKVEKAANDFRDWLDSNALGVPVGWMLLPFIGTPWKVFKAAAKLTPLQALKMANTAIKAKQGKVADEEMVREIADTLLSAAVFWALWGLVNGGDDDEPLITGSPAERGGERDMQWRTAPPLSIRIGPGQYASYGGYEPAAMSIGVMVDMVGAWNKAAQSGNSEAMGAMAGDMFASIKNQLGDKTFLRTVGDLQRLVEGYTTVPNFARDLVVTPMMPNVVRSGLRSADKVYRQNMAREQEGVSAWRQMFSTLPYAMLPSGSASWTPPPKRDAWGREIKRQGDALIPWDLLGRQLPLFKLTKTDPTLAADLALRRWNRAVESGRVDGDPFWPRAPRYSSGTGDRKVIWTPEEYDELVRLAGEGARSAVGQIDFSFLDAEDGMPSEQTIDEIRKLFTRAKSNATREMKRRRQEAR